jgi:hypothetical protein
LTFLRNKASNKHIKIHVSGVIRKLSNFDSQKNIAVIIFMQIKLLNM